MKVNLKSFYYAPISHPNIALLYPWNDWTIDLISLLSSSRHRKSYITYLKKIFNHDDIFLTNSGSAALTLSIKSLHLPSKAEILIASFNCFAVIDSVISADAKPVFIDINSKGGIDMKSAKKALSKNTKAIIVTNIYGLADNFEELEKFCRNNNLYFINDLAQTFDNLDSKKRLNKYGDISMYSFGSEKHIFSLGGGCALINNKNLLKNMEELYPKIISENADALRLLLKRSIYYLKFIGHYLFPQQILFNKQKKGIDITKHKQINISQMSNSQLYSLVHKVLKYKRYRKSTYKNFNFLCQNIKYSVFRNQNGYNSLPLYATLKMNESTRCELAARLDQCGIPSTWNYLPLYYYDAYKKYKVIDNKSTEEIWKRVLSIPFRYPINERVLRRIIDVINN
jgi:perosamine synthetase